MNLYAMTDKAICAELGSRLKALRLRRNLTQQQVADAAAVSLNVVKALEKGRGKLSSLVAVLRELQGLDDMEQFIAIPEISPLELAKRQGKVRQRASGQRAAKARQGADEW